MRSTVLGMFWLFSATIGVAAEPYELTGSVDYRDTVSDNAFFGDLVEMHGKLVDLDLILIPGSNSGTEAEGFEISKEEDPAEEIGQCTGNNFGYYDNYHSEFRVGFGAPNHYHSPTILYVGKRKDFLKNSVLCEYINVSNGLISQLRVTGRFFVQSAEIPTANETYLFPAND